MDKTNGLLFFAKTGEGVNTNTNNLTGLEELIMLDTTPQQMLVDLIVWRDRLR